MGGTEQRRKNGKREKKHSGGKRKKGKGKEEKETEKYVKKGHLTSFIICKERSP